MQELKTLYETNFSVWALRNAELLQHGRFTELDIEHLLEELTDMGTSERNELESRLTVLLAHLLKWEHQYQKLNERWREFKGDSWRATIIEQRNRITKRLKRSPGLKSSIGDVIIGAYPDAVELAADESGLVADTFPQRCPYSIAQLLDKNFYPNTASNL